MTMNKQQHKDWTEELPSRLEGLEAAPPEGLWEGIAAGVPALSGTKRRVLPLWVWMASASVAAAAAVLAVFLWPINPSEASPEAVYVASVVEEEPVERTAAETIIPEVVEEDDDCIEASEEVVVRMVKKEEAPSCIALRQTVDDSSTEVENNTEVSMEEQLEEALLTGSNLPSTDAGERPSSPEDKTASERAKAVSDHDRERFVNEDDFSPGTPPPFAVKKPYRRAVRLGLSSGQYLADNHISSSPGYGLPATGRMLAAPAPGVLAMVTRNQPSTTESRHAIPMRLALTLQIGLTPRWSVETGLAATTLDSRFTTTAGFSSVVTNRRSTYLGIPLSFHYKAWEWKRLSLYGALGGEYDQAVRTQTTQVTYSGETALDTKKDGHLLKDHSWSLSGAVGAQLRLWDSGLLFVQPGLAWHIPRGDDAPETAFTARPLIPEMTFGLRICL